VRAKDLSNKIVDLLKNIDEPLETKEIINKLSQKTRAITRTKILYRLMILRGDGAICGKRVGSGKGVWVWWQK